MQSTLDRISQWMTRQSWYLTAADGVPRLRELAEVFLPSRDPSTRVRVIVVRDDTPFEPVVYQIPIVERDLAPDDSDPAFIGRGYGGAFLFDGMRDPAFPAALLAAMHDADRLDDERDDRILVSSRLVSDKSAIAELRAEPYGRPELTMRVYRRPLRGGHPDAIAAEALAVTGSELQPRLAGTLAIEWIEDGEATPAHLAMVTQTTAGDADGWSLAIDTARAGLSFTRDAARLGESLARTHAWLADRMPTRAVTADEVGRSVDAWRARLAATAEAIPQLAAMRDAIESIYELAAGLPEWPDLQTVHGALDLAATRRSSDGDWSLRDFGGPAPLESDDRTDVAVHDVVGALRSIDYAGALAGDTPPRWVEDASTAFLSGYESVLGQSALPVALIAARLIDLAVVDAAYESRRRPQYLHIPIAVVERLTAGMRQSIAA